MYNVLLAYTRENVTDIWICTQMCTPNIQSYIFVSSARSLPPAAANAAVCQLKLSIGYSIRGYQLLNTL